ncbi:MAG: glucose 1-dehydrogenase [Solirubrobacterales bacterium]|nr:glucose 1-dehydrogenase [Solirubrobacterales bacterium]
MAEHDARQGPELAGRVAIVTGGGRGIGRAIALALAREGARVAVAGRGMDRLEATAAEIESAGGEAIAVRADLREPPEVEALAAAARDRLGPVDVLVNNSGVAGPTKELWEVTPEEWADTFAVNVAGTFLCCRAVLPAMIERRRGSVIVIGSMSGRRPLYARTPYTASKAALIGLVRTLAAETGPHGVRVNLLSPGAVAGERLDAVIAKQAEATGVGEDEVRERFALRSPLRRPVDAAEVADAAVFLASDRSSAMTGHDLDVNAGAAMG